MKSQEIRDEMAQGRGHFINHILLGTYIDEQIKNIGIEQHQIIIFDRQIDQVVSNVQHSKPVKLVGVNAKGKYIFEPRIEDIWFTPALSFELVDALEMLENGEYTVYP